MSHVELVTVIVDDYDEAIRFFVDVLGFELVEDTPASTNDGRPKRWVVVRPVGTGTGTGLLLARADGPIQQSAVGAQTAGRVGFFLRVDDFADAYERLRAAGVAFTSPPRDESYGRVAVFVDIAGNKWDLLGPASRNDGGMPTADASPADLPADLPAVVVQRDGDIVTVSLNRPDKGNGINLALCAGLRAAARALAHDPAVTAVVLRANGPRFCVGGDIAEFAAAGERMPEFVDALATDLHDAILHFQAANAPVIAAVKGSCAGAGIGLAIGADLVVAGESASFTIGYPGVGLSPDGGSSFFLSRIIGLRRAMEMVLTNRTIGAAEAKEWGLVNEVVPDEEVDQRAQALARQVSKFPVAALGAARHLVIEGASSALADALHRESHMIATMAATPQAKERVAAFINRAK